MPVALQDALSALAPRAAGRLTAEPQVAFDLVQESLHATDRCPYTCGAGCSYNTAFCRATGHTV